MEDWRKLDSERHVANRANNIPAMHRAKDSMGAMAKSLERDPQVESILRARRPELGIDFDTGRKLSHDLASSIGVEIGRKLDLSL